MDAVPHSELSPLKACRRVVQIRRDAAAMVKHSYLSEQQAIITLAQCQPNSRDRCTNERCQNDSATQKRITSYPACETFLLLKARTLGTHTNIRRKKQVQETDFHFENFCT